MTTTVDVSAQQPINPREKLKELIIRIETPHYLIAGTVRQDEFQKYAEHLEAIHAEYTRGFSGLLTEKSKPARKSPPRKPPTQDAKPSTGSATPAKGEANLGDADDTKFHVIIFAKSREYHEFGQLFRLGRTEHTAGMYIPSYKLLLIVAEDKNFTINVLYHEAFHQFLDRYVADPPTWLNEGLASYYETGRFTRNGIIFDEPRKDHWDLCRQMVRENAAIPLTDVVHASHREFYDARQLPLGRSGSTLRVSACYAEAYTFIHMLLTDAEGRRRLQNLVRDLSKDNGRNTAKIVDKYFDPATCQQLSQAWINHVNSRPDSVRSGGGR